MRARVSWPVSRGFCGCVTWVPAHNRTLLLFWLGREVRRPTLMLRELHQAAHSRCPPCLLIHYSAPKCMTLRPSGSPVPSIHHHQKHRLAPPHTSTPLGWIALAPCAPKKMVQV